MADDEHRRVLLNRDVWVSLTKLFRPGSGSPPLEHLDTFVDLSGEVEGVLSQWHRGVRGEWLGEVSYNIKNAAGRTQHFPRQLVPAAAIRPRKVGAYPGEGPW